MSRLLHQVSHLLTLFFRQFNAIEHVALRILRHTGCRQSAVMHEARTTAVTVRIVYSSLFRFAIQRERLYGDSCKHPSGGVKLRKALD